MAGSVERNLLYYRPCNKKSLPKFTLSIVEGDEITKVMRSAIEKDKCPKNNIEEMP